MARRRVEYVVSVKDEASANLKKVKGSVDSIESSIKSLARTAAAALSVRQIYQWADSYRLLQNRIRLVTKDQQELDAVTQRLVDVSLRSRTAFDATANLYARVARSSRELGLSQEELIQFTETVSKSIRVSGSTAAEASAGVIQFGQALASSRLSGDELRSVLEQMPRLAQAIAEGMGIGIGRLREFGEEGKLTTDVVLEALRKAAPQIAAEFEQLKPLMSEAFTNLESSVLSAIGKLDEATGVSDTLAESFVWLADQISVVTNLLSGTATGDIQKLDEEMRFFATTVLVAAAGLQILGQAFIAVFQNTIGAAGNIISTFAQQIVHLSQGELEEAASLGEMLAAELGAGFVEGAETLNKDIVETMQQLFENLDVLYGNITRNPPEVDLSVSGKGITPISKDVLQAIKQATDQGQNWVKTLTQQREALFIAAESGIEYSDALDRVKANAIAAAAGNADLGAEIIALLQDVNTLNKEAANEALLKGLEQERYLLNVSNKERYIQQQLMQVSIDQMAVYGQRVREAAGALYDQLYGGQAIIDSLEMELQMIKLTNRERFIQQQLVKLNAEEIEKYGETIRRLAGELFDRQEEIDKELKFMENLAQRAAQNMQDAFADFLFDPFDKGVKGMLKSFVDAIRRMLAEALAFHVLSGIPFFSQFLPTRAAGGPVLAGQPVLVGERGPELFVPEANGRIRNNSAMSASGGASGSGMQFVTNIDARGADPGLIARLPQIMEQRDRQLLLKVGELLETGSITP